MLKNVFLLTILFLSVRADRTQLILMGGHEVAEWKTEIYNEIIYLTGGLDDTKLCFITVAGNDPESDKKSYMADFEKLGVKVENMFWLNVNKDDSNVANDAKLVGMAEECTGYFFGGGDQDRIVAALLTKDRKDTEVMKVIRSRFNNAKATIAGTSGGAECQTSLGMLIAGNSYEGLKDGSKPIDSVDVKENDLTYDAKGGLSIVDIVVDVHFSQRGRQGRLMRLMADFWEHERFFSVGIDENTALIITYDKDDDYMNGKVVGEGGVYIFNFDDAKINDKSITFEVKGIKTSYLRNGDIFALSDFKAGKNFDIKVMFESRKQYLDNQGHLDKPITSNDIFKTTSHDQLGEYQKVVESLADSKSATRTTYGLSKETNPQFKLDFIADYSNGFVAYGNLGDTKTTDICYHKLIVNVSVQK